MKPKGENEWLSKEEQKRKKQFRIMEGDPEEEEEEEEEEGGQRACVQGQVGLYGYRRQALCVVLMGLLFLVILNLGMTLWMLKVMEFSAEGLGPLTILRRGIKLNGKSLVMDQLVASKITSRERQPIRIESNAGISLISRAVNPSALPGGVGSSPPENKLLLADDELQIYASGVRISDPKGRVLFAADKKEVLVGAEQLKVTGEGGAAFHGSVQTPLVRSSAGNELRLESPTRSLNVFALHGVGIESRAGDITATCLKDLSFQSKAGSLKIDTQNVYMGKLPAAQLKGSRLPAAGEPVEEEEDGSSSPGTAATLSRVAGRTAPEVFQVCVCGGKGRVFLAPAAGPCFTMADSDICR